MKQSVGKYFFADNLCTLSSKIATRAKQISSESRAHHLTKTFYSDFFFCEKCFKFNLHCNNCCCTDKSSPTYWNRTINKPNILKHVTRHWICSCWVCIRQLYYLSFWKSQEVYSRSRVHRVTFEEQFGLREKNIWKLNDQLVGSNLSH
jgi:hypothetical protein